MCCVFNLHGKYICISVWFETQKLKCNTNITLSTFLTPCILAWALLSAPLPQLTFHTPQGAITFSSHSDVSSLSASTAILMILCLIRGSIQQTIPWLEKVTWIQLYWKGFKALRNITSLSCPSCLFLLVMNVVIFLCGPCWLTKTAATDFLWSY